MEEMGEGRGCVAELTFFIVGIEAISKNEQLNLRIAVINNSNVQKKKENSYIIVLRNYQRRRIHKELVTTIDIS